MYPLSVVPCGIKALYVFSYRSYVDWYDVACSRWTRWQTTVMVVWKEACLSRTDSCFCFAETILRFFSCYHWLKDIGVLPLTLNNNLWHTTFRQSVSHSDELLYCISASASGKKYSRLRLLLRIKPQWLSRCCIPWSKRYVWLWYGRCTCKNVKKRRSLE